MALILCTGSDPALMKTRQLILEKAGHTVIIAMDESAVETVCQHQKFDVAVIGQTVAEKTKRHLMSLVREYCPSAKILELYQPYNGKTLDDADSWLEVPAGVPSQLADCVTALASA